MFSHVTVGSNDVEKSQRFYDSLFASIGAGPATKDDKNRLFYTHKGAIFIVTPPINGKPATYGNGITIGFAIDSPEQAHAWHDAGVAAGGTSVEDPPGVREGEYGKLYVAYLRDPDGNKLCALHWLETK